jgi:hypothetical protein
MNDCIWSWFRFCKKCDGLHNCKKYLSINSKDGNILENKFKNPFYKLWIKLTFKIKGDLL